MKNSKPLIRRTFLQERFEVLIKKQLNGQATFNDLTELDWIVNRDPKLRDIILEEMQCNDDNSQPNDYNPEQWLTPPSTLQQQSLLSKIKHWLSKWFITKHHSLTGVSN
ncbi:hypothetical protein FPZ43_00940 [Mucilaginibacter pallidiroseus]|uniref:Uncharacterized protein n=1 Tax=Mucilaginibacter pallidiroseus TaxID=2599295 RepID=A0A563UI48_9SPHI|nr:hypothetical protein [Mucilaginibacter pallidiroseus]TWR31080.1 hypothetical protein FPZ43_00940 [Mucilaginibacter pallidiroseus]